ncbi:MAG: serine/threonine protein kinase, partial [Planctomycetes bacterium]|nr:serine/threonine protein kinase [Planctomycetota bacterium]
ASPAPAPADTGKTVADSVVTSASSVAGESLERGRVIAGYRIEGLLGKGGMGQVYRATQLSVQRPVALKVLSPRLAKDTDFRERFLREARAAGGLHHFNLIAVHDVGEAGGLMFFSMELVEGRTVKDLITAGGLGIDQSLDIARQTLLALAYAHQHGVIHRDIKPDNIMVDANGAVKVADLGLSRIDDASSRDDGGSTHAGTIMGTPLYMSPEQGRDAHAADHRSDLYSLGATLYHMVCNCVPFPGKTPVEVVLKSATQPLTFPEPGPPPQLRTFITTLMAKDPAERPASAKDAIELLDRVRRTDSFTADPTRRIRRYIHRRRRLRRLAQAGGALLISLAVLFLTVSLVSRRMASDAWDRESSRIVKLADDNNYVDALAQLQSDIERMPAGSPHARSAEELRAKIEDSWEARSQERGAPYLAAFDAAVRDKRFNEAWKSLKDIPSALGSPKMKQAIEDREDAFGHAIDEASAAKPAEAKAQNWEELARQGEMLFANALWREFSFAPPDTVQLRDGIARFTGSGRGAYSKAIQGARSRHAELDFFLRPTAPLSKGQQWQLILGASVVTVDDRGATLVRDGREEPLTSPSGTLMVRLRRTPSGYVLYSGDRWLPFANSGDGRLQLAWKLDAGNHLDVMVRPVYLGDRAPPAKP